MMCNFVPFATTAAILASSMTLVGIAVDRYYAVMKAVIGFWQPTVISSSVCMFCIWLASVGIACPVLTIYNMLPVYVLTEENETDVSGVGTTISTTTASTAESRLLVTAKITSKAGETVAATSSFAEATTAAETKTETPWEMDVSQEDYTYTLVREQELVNMCISNEVRRIYLRNLLGLSLNYFPLAEGCHFVLRDCLRHHFHTLYRSLLLV